jgi:diacylglycerol kinase (ATP)
MLMVIASNGKSLGGAFQIAPRASVTDGKLDFCFISDANFANRVRLFARALRGTHIGMPQVTAAATDYTNLSFLAKPAIEMDGELRMARDRTVELTCLPRALAVIAAPGAVNGGPD